MYVGVDYYPEHWPRSRWETDVKLMRKAGFNVVRLAEFAWINMEPEEDTFDFGWLDDALGLLRKHGISAILGTPTAIVPAWMKRKYPEVMAVGNNEQRHVWGIRKDTCYSSSILRHQSRKITGAMAQHFSATPNVIGWQTDNEFGHPFCFCETCRNQFQEWLHNKYATLDELNRAWGTHFWGHRVGRWDEIEIPRSWETYNPSQVLDWRRFYSWLNVRFQHDQVEILRETCPRHFVTHNLMGMFPHIDYYELSKDLDFVSWDNYPVGGAPGVRFGASMAADLMRGVKKKNFWIMEQTAGPPGWGRFGRNVRPGELRSVAYQQLAHGCDGQVWFRWRTCTAGREQYWHGLLGHDGRGLRRYKEAAQTAGEYHKLAGHLEGTTVKSRVALIYDYDSRWAHETQPSYQACNYVSALQRYYDALTRAGVNVDVVAPSVDFSKYRVVVAPHLYVLPDNIARRLDRFVKNGGILLADCRTGVKDQDNLCHERTLPGLLSDTLGIEIQEYESLARDMKYAVQGSGGLEGEYEAVHYADWVLPRKANALAEYREWFMKNYAAVTRNTYGKGAGYYIGTVAEQPALYDKVVAAVLKDARVRGAVKPPEGVEASVRQGSGKKLLFLINHTEEKRTVKVPQGKTELISGTKTGKELVLQRHGVAVIKLR